MIRTPKTIEDLYMRLVEIEAQIEALSLERDDLQAQILDVEADYDFDLDSGLNAL